MRHKLLCALLLPVAASAHAGAYENADDRLGSECAGDVAEKRACAEQPLMVSLRKGKNGVWSGALLHYLVRGVYGEGGKLTGWYRLGISEELRVAPAKR